MADNLNKSVRLNIFFKYTNIFFTVVSGILLVPIYLNYLPINQYGAWLTVGSFATWFAVFDPGIANLLIQKVSHSMASNNRQALLGYAVAGIACSSVLAVIVLLFGISISPMVIAWLVIADVNRDLLILALRIAVANTALMIITFAILGTMQGLHNSLSVGLLTNLRAVMRIVFAIILLKAGYGLLALPITELIASGIMLTVAILNLIVIFGREKGDSRPSFERLGEFTRLFAYSFGARLGKVITGNIDNILIARYIGVEQVAAYSITATVPRQAENLINQPIAAFRPPLAHLAGEASPEKLSSYIERMLRWVIWMSGWVLTCLISLNADFVMLWVGACGFAGYNIAIGLAVLFWIRVWTNSTGTIGFSLGDIKRNSFAEWAYSLLLVPALLVGALFWGLSGIVFAQIAIQLLTMAWYFPWSIWRRLQWKKEKNSGLLLQVFFTIFAGAIASLVHPSAETWKGLIIAGLSVTGAYFIILATVSPIFRREATNWRRILN